MVHAHMHVYVHKHVFTCSSMGFSTSGHIAPLHLCMSVCMFLGRQVCMGVMAWPRHRTGVIYSSRLWFPA